MPALRSPEDMLTTELKEIYSAERQLSRAIPRLSKKIHSDKLREMFEQRVEQGETLIERLEDVLEAMDAPKSTPKNIAAEGLIDDVNHHLEEVEDDRLVDPLLLASVQKIEHYCIAAWGTAKAMGELLGQEKVVQCMDEVLKEGRQFDEEMTRLAEEEINPQMMADDEMEENEGAAEEASTRRGKSAKSRKRH